MKRKILAQFLALGLALTSLPVSASAAEITEDVAVEAEAVESTGEGTEVAEDVATESADSSEAEEKTDSIETEESDDTEALENKEAVEDEDNLSERTVRNATTKCRNHWFFRWGASWSLPYY